MFVGHALLAFALVGLLGRRMGIPARRALTLAVVAGLFATLPDVDILYGPVGLFGGFSGVADAVDTFWTTGNVVHRGPTHSLLVGGVAAGAFALVARSSLPSRLLGVGTLGTLAVVAMTTSGALDAAIVAVFALVGLGIVALARRLALDSSDVLGVALVGLLSHPFGDLLTGSPPDFLYPFDVVAVGGRLSLHGDGTIHLLGAFALELAVVWLAVAVYFDLTGRSLVAHVDRRAALGVVYGAAVFVLPAPTIHSASPFVFSVLSLGLIGTVPTRRSFRPVGVRAVATGLGAVSLAAVAYAVTYVLLWTA